MDQEQFHQVVDGNLVPMLQATLQAQAQTSTPQEALVAYVDPIHIGVKPTRDAGYRLILTRSQPFTPQERRLAGHFIQELAAVIALEAGAYQPDLLRAIQRRVVARDLAEGTRRASLISVFERLETWSSQTYEGQRIVSSVGLDGDPAGTGIPLDDLWNEPFAPVLTNGFDTLLVAGSDSEVNGVVQLRTGESSRTAPYRMGEIAWWASGDRIATVLNQRGEILVFKARSLRFARRSGSWHHYVHDTNIRRMSPPFDRDLREAIYESCLDVSFARTGGCIGVADYANRDGAARLVSADDLLAGATSYKARLLSQFIGRKTFQALDRRARIELLSLDGAMVLSHTGVVLAAGSIIEVPAGSVGGGGRSAAAQKLSEIGLGIKVSQDGTITGYRGRQPIFRS